MYQCAGTPARDTQNKQMVSTTKGLELKEI
jgi:hypothetical protein